MPKRTASLLWVGLVASIVAMVVPPVLSPDSYNCAVPMAYAAGPSYVRQNNPVCRQSLQLATFQLVDAASEDVQNQETSPASYMYPGRTIFTEDQYVAVYRDGGTPHYERLAFASGTIPSAIPEWYQVTGTDTIVPVRGTGENVGIVRAADNDSTFGLQVGDATVATGGAIRIEGHSSNGSVAILSVLGGLSGVAELQARTQSAAGVGFGEIYMNTAIPLHLGTSASHNMTIVGSGFVGIGTEGPDTRLHVLQGSAGGVTADVNTALTIEDSADAYLSILTPLANNGAILFGRPGANNRGGIFYNHTNDDLAFRNAGNSQQMVIDSNGDLGLETLSPASRLHVEGTDSDGVNGPHVRFTTSADTTHPVLQFSNMTHDNVSINFDAYYDGVWKSGDAGSNFQIYKIVDLLRFRYDSGVGAGGTPTWNEGIVMDVAGKVGLGGITAMDTTLHVADGSAGAIAAVANSVVTIENSTDAFLSFLTPNANTRGIFFGDDNSNVQGGIVYNGSDELEFRTATNTQRWKIDGSGHLLGGADATYHIGDLATTGRPSNVYIANDIKDVRLIHADQGSPPDDTAAPSAPYTCTISGGFTGVAGCLVLTDSRSMRGHVVVTMTGEYGSVVAGIGYVQVTFTNAFDASTNDNGSRVPLVQAYEDAGSVSPCDGINHQTIMIEDYGYLGFIFAIDFHGSTPATADVCNFVYHVMG